jgi:translocation and assembly module TamA
VSGNAGGTVANRTASWILASVTAVALFSTSAMSQNIGFVVEGAPDSVAKTLRANSLLVGLETAGNGTSLDFVAAARADYRQILTGLYAEGYYGGTVSILIDGTEAAAIAPLDAPTQINSISISVSAGPRFTFGQTQIGPLAPETTLPPDFATGQVARSETIRTAVISAVDAWRAQGNAKADVADQSIIARHNEQTLDASVTIAPGPKLTFGALSVSGNVAVDPERIRQIAGLPEGQVYSPDDMDRATARLRRTGAFRSVALVEADAIGAGNTLPVEAQVVEQKPRRLGYGVELSSVDGLTLSGYWLHRNFLGGAEQFRADAKISGLGGETGGPDLSVGVSYLRPGTLHPDADFYAKAGIEHLDEPDYVLDQINAEVGLTRILRDGTKIASGLGLIAARQTDSGGTQDFILATLPLSAERDRRDSALDATQGYYLALDVTPFIGLQGSASGARVYADGRYYKSIGADDRTTLAFRGQLGSVIGTSATDVPADFLFYSGGGDTVRGQPYQSLGVDLGGGVTIGGQSFLALSSEARFDLNDKIGLVGFFDLGFVGADSLSFANGGWQSGAGLGLRYQTGIGPIRIDVATPTSGASVGKSVNFYVGIGQSF